MHEIESVQMHKTAPKARPCGKSEERSSEKSDDDILATGFLSMSVCVLTGHGGNGYL